MRPSELPRVRALPMARVGHGIRGARGPPTVFLGDVRRSEIADRQAVLGWLDGRVSTPVLVR